MATVTSLTQSKIEELMAGWVGVELSQDEINVLIGQLWTDVGSQGANLENFAEVILPTLETELAANSIAVSDLAQQIPDLETAITANESLITNLNTVTIPFLQGELASANDWIIELNEITLPDLYTQLGANNDLITEFNTVTLPDLNARIDAVEGGGGGFDPTELQAAIDALEGKFPVVGDDIAADTITSNNIEAHTITALEIAADTITANEIAADAITANEIAAHTITAAEIFAGTITAEEIATDTITANEIAADAITANEIAGHTITAAEIFAGTITTNEIATDTITANNIAADAITANEIAADTITADEIAAGTITGTEILAGSITALEIATGAITADEIFAGAVTAEKVSSEIIVANELYSREGYFGVIQAEQITSGAIDAELGLLGKLQVGEITIDKETGIQVPGPNGLTLLSSTGVGHRFAGAVDTDEVTINGGLTVNAANNTINGQVKLSNVVIPPTQPAAATKYWPYTTPTMPDILGLTDSHDGTKWVSVVIPASGERYVKSCNKVTGAVVDNLPATHFHHDYVAYSIARVGGYYFMNMWMQSTGEWWLCRCSPTFTGFVALQRLASLSNIGSVTVGRDDTNNEVMAAWRSTAGDTMTVRTYTTAGVQTSSLAYTAVQSDGVNWMTSSGGYAMGIGRGPVGKSGEDQVWAVFGSSIRFFNATTRALDWWPGAPESPKGVCVEFGQTNKMRFVGYNTYRVYEWVREATWPSNVPISITYSWFDSKLAGSGKHETTPAPAYSFDTPWYWAGIQVDASAPSNTGGDDSPDSVVIYFDNNRQPEVPVGKVSNIFRSKVASGIPAKTTNEFVGAAAYPGSIMADATMTDGITPRFLVRGDGQGNWGNLVVDGFGKATIGGDTGWIAVTTFVNLWENYGSVYPPVRYRKIGNRVWLSGLIRGPGNLGGNMFTLPVGFRPLYQTMFTAVIANFVAEFAATGDSPPTFNTGQPSGTVANHTHPVNSPALDIRTDVTLSSVAGRLDVKTTGEVAHAGGAPWTAGTNWISLDNVTFLVD